MSRYLSVCCWLWVALTQCLWGEWMGHCFCMSVWWWGRNRGGFYRRKGWSSSDATWSLLVEGEEEGVERAEQQPLLALWEEKSFRIFLEIFAPTVRCSPSFPQIFKKTVSYVLLCIFGSYGIRRVTYFSICTHNKTGVKMPYSIWPLRTQVLLQPRGRRQSLAGEWVLLHFLFLPMGLQVLSPVCSPDTVYSSLSSPSTSCSSFPPIPPDPWKLGRCAKFMNISLH